MIFRVVFGVVLIISAFVLPWWVSFILSLIGLFSFRRLYEVVFVGIILDSLYPIPFSIWGFDFIFTLFFIIALYLIVKFRKNLLV
jgi:hypothetical protein